MAPSTPAAASVPEYTQDVPSCRRHPATTQLLQFFAYLHLPPNLQAVSKPFRDLAEVVASGPNNAETTVCLRKLLEAKDCAIRAALL